MISRKLPREPMITIEDDDGWIGFYTVLYELAKEYNIPMTSAMITSRAMSFPGDNRPQRPQNYNYEQVMEMQESGLIEFVSHSHNHERLSEMSEEDIREDFNTTQNFMKKYGFNHRAITIPFGDYGNREIGIIKEFFDYSTGGIKEKTIVKQPANNYLLGRISSELPFSELEQYMDEAVAEDGWLIICTHVGQDSDSSKEYYESIIQSALSKGLKFVKLEEGIKHHGNIAQFGGTNREPATTISSDDVYGKLLGRVRYAERNEGIDANTPITEFQKNTITFTDINTPSADGFPGNFPGILYTHRYTEIPYSRQTYITSRDYKEFVRMWDVDNNKWGDWVTTGTVQYLGLNAIKATDHPTSFNLQRKISVTQIDSRGNDGFPNNESGLLFNYALHSGTVFPFQEYKVFRDNREYRRYWVDGSWTVWTPLSYYRRLSTNVRTGLDPIEEYDMGMTTCLINSHGDRSGLPDESSGILTTFKESTDSPAFNYQEFKKYNSFDKYIRYANTDGTWSGWRKFALEEVV